VNSACGGFAGRGLPESTRDMAGLMQIIEVTELRPGQRFPMPMFHGSGRKLLSADTVLTQLHIDAIVRTKLDRVFVAPDAHAVLEHGKTVPAATISAKDLVVGTTAQTDLMTPDGVVLVQQNEQIEEHHLAALRDSGIEDVIVRPKGDADAMRGMLHDLEKVAIKHLEGQLRSGECLRAVQSLTPLKRALAGRTQSEILKLNGIQLLRRRMSSRLQPVYGMLETGKAPNLQVLGNIVNDLLDLQKTEPRQFSQLALMTQRRDDYLPDHAISVAVLAMAIGTQLGLSLEHVQEHPALSLTMMEQVTGLSAIPRIIGYQHHERANGTGYPAKAVMPNISDFAAIVSVADIYAATTNPRAYKSSKLPYNAMEEVVRMAHKGLLDVRIVKGLLEAVGLFPVGSFVQLSNGMAAQVVGANPARIDRPLVCTLTGGALDPTVSDLSAEAYSHIKIVRAVPTPTRFEQSAQPVAVNGAA